eukprot:5068040-Pyramimonas_sp.AAC.1
MALPLQSRNQQGHFRLSASQGQGDVFNCLTHKPAHHPTLAHTARDEGVWDAPAELCAEGAALLPPAQQTSAAPPKKHIERVRGALVTLCTPVTPIPDHTKRVRGALATRFTPVTPIPDHTKRVRGAS